MLGWEVRQPTDHKQILNIQFTKDKRTRSSPEIVYRWSYSVGVGVGIVGVAGVEGEDNDRFNKKPTIIPISATKSANLKEKPGSLFRFLRLFNISCKSGENIDCENGV